MLVISFLTPFRFIEYLIFNRKIKRATITKPPIFIIGHWRNGTTYLHNLMTVDKQFAYFNMFEMVYPHIFLGFERLFKPFFTLTLPKKRPMDNVLINFDTPQEEENGIANLCSLSINIACVFPNNRDRYLKYGNFKKVSEKEIKIWKLTYLKYLKKLSIKNMGKQLLIKSPANTFRIALLHDLFPEAKFIHIKRDPYTTFFFNEEII